MVYEFSLDLKVARRRSSLSQSDCAHLLGVDASRISKLESGKSTPSVVELALLCLIFNLPIGSIGQEIVLSILHDLQQRLASMPGCPENWPGRDTRVRTLNALSEKLKALALGLNG